MNIKLETILAMLFESGENSVPETMAKIIEYLEGVAEEELGYFKSGRDNHEEGVDDSMTESYEKVFAHLQKARKAIL